MSRFILIAITALLPATAFAKDDNAEMAACRQYHEKFCSQVMPGEGRQMKCLYDIRDQLSPACAAIITEKYERFEKLRRDKESK